MPCRPPGRGLWLLVLASSVGTTEAYKLGGYKNAKMANDGWACNHSMLCGSLRCLKQLKRMAANGVLKVRAWCGHCFTQAQHLMHFRLSVLHSLPFAMAPDGHIVEQ